MELQLSENSEKRSKALLSTLRSLHYEKLPAVFEGLIACFDVELDSEKQDERIEFLKQFLNYFYQGLKMTEYEYQNLKARGEI